MEIYSARKPAKGRATLAATSILMVTAVLLSFHMVEQKHGRWNSLLGEVLVVDAQLSLRVPETWQSSPVQSPYELLLRGELASEPGKYDFGVVRLPRQHVMSMGEAFNDALRRSGAITPVLELPPAACRFARAAVIMRGFEWIGQDGEPIVLRVIVAADGAGRMTILMLRVAGGSDEAARGLLRHIATSADFTTPS